MKTYEIALIYLAFLLISFFNKAEAQSLNKLDFDQIAVKKNTGTTTGSKYCPRGTSSSLVAALGKPMSITTEYSEIDEVDMTVYNYNGAKFYFIEGYGHGFNITSNNYHIVTNSTLDSEDSLKNYYKVGDPVSKVQANYPDSYNSRDKNRIFFRLYQKETKQNEEQTNQKALVTDLDDVLLFVYKDGTITGIYF